MNHLTLLELHELLYCIGYTLKSETACVNRKTAERLHKEIKQELTQRCEAIDRLMMAETDAFNKWG